MQTLINILLITVLSSAIVIFSAAVQTVCDWIDERWNRIKRKRHLRKRIFEWQSLAEEESDPIAKAYKAAVFCWYASEYHAMRNSKNPKNIIHKTRNDALLTEILYGYARAGSAQK